MIQDTGLVSTILPQATTVFAENDNATLYVNDVGSIGLVLVLSVSAVVLFLCVAGLLYRHITFSTGPHERKQTVLPSIVDVPPRYSEVIPPTYEWALQHSNKPHNIVILHVDGNDIARPNLAH